MYMQKVRPIPTPNLMVGEDGQKSVDMKDALPAFRSTIANPALFQKQFRIEMKRFEMMIGANHTGLLHDFQAGPFRIPGCDRHQYDGPLAPSLHGANTRYGHTGG